MSAGDTLPAIALFSTTSPSNYPSDSPSFPTHNPTHNPTLTPTLTPSKNPIHLPNVPVYDLDDLFLNWNFTAPINYFTSEVLEFNFTVNFTTGNQFDANASCGVCQSHPYMGYGNCTAINENVYGDFVFGIKQSTSYFVGNRFSLRLWEYNASSIMSHFYYDKAIILHYSECRIAIGLDLSEEAVQYFSVEAMQPGVIPLKVGVSFSQPVFPVQDESINISTFPIGEIVNFTKTAIAHPPFETSKCALWGRM